MSTTIKSILMVGTVVLALMLAGLVNTANAEEPTYGVTDLVCQSSSELKTFLALPIEHKNEAWRSIQARNACQYNSNSYWIGQVYERLTDDQNYKMTSEVTVRGYIGRVSKIGDQPVFALILVGDKFDQMIDTALGQENS